MKLNTISIEPKWKDLLPLFIDWLERGKPEQKKLAIDELKKMAVVCDQVREMEKSGKTYTFKNGTFMEAREDE